MMGSIFHIGFIILVFDSGRTNTNSMANFVHPRENDAVENNLYIFRSFYIVIVLVLFRYSDYFSLFLE